MSILYALTFSMFHVLHKDLCMIVVPCLSQDIVPRILTVDIFNRLYIYTGFSVYVYVYIYIYYIYIYT